MNAETKIARQRLSVLQLAEELGNITEACWRQGMDRTSFCEWRRRFQTHGLEGLKDLPSIHKSHPQTTPQETIDRIVEVTLDHPSGGCNRIEALLKLDSRRVSPSTVQKILDRNEFGTRYHRWLALERRACEEAFELTAEQVAFI